MVRVVIVFRYEQNEDVSMLGGESRLNVRR